jgi:hypothetical protein
MSEADRRRLVLSKVRPCLVALKEPVEGTLSVVDLLEQLGLTEGVE